MIVQQEIPSEAEFRSAMVAAGRLKEDGFLRLPADAYENCDPAGVNLLQNSYFSLPADDDGGERFRAYGKLVWRDGRFEVTASSGYTQSTDYNYTEGGKVRKFAPLSSEIMQSRVLRSIIETDMRIARCTELVSFARSVVIGVHQVRYRPTAECPSYSSPPWLHKDDEEVVFIHLINMSANAIGGDNVIARDQRSFETVIRLDHPLDTLCVNKAKFHAVTPVGVSSGRCGYRDILLVTFSAEA